MSYNKYSLISKSFDVEPVLALAGTRAVTRLNPWGLFRQREDDVVTAKKRSPALPAPDSDVGIRYVQRHLGLSIDGIVGPKTLRAVSDYRARHGLNGRESTGR